MIKRQLCFVGDHGHNHFGMAYTKGDVMTQLLVVNGSYRENGAIDQVTEVAVQAASEAGVAIEVI